MPRTSALIRSLEERPLGGIESNSCELLGALYDADLEAEGSEEVAFGPEEPVRAICSMRWAELRCVFGRDLGTGVKPAACV